VQDSETVTYGAVSNVTAGLDLVTNGLADFLVTDGALSSAQLGAGKLRVPLIGSAIVAAYHLPSLTATYPPLVRLAARSLPTNGDDTLHPTKNHHGTSSEWWTGVSFYNIFCELLTFECLQVLDGTVLAAIWVGNITSWNDTAIVNLNPSLSGKLPTEQIALSFSTGDVPFAILFSAFYLFIYLFYYLTLQCRP